VTDALDTLRLCRSVLVIDWPSPDVPDSLARAGYTVFVKGGPGPRDYSARELRGDEVLTRATGEPPTHVDLVYSHRPPAELEGIVAIARELGALAVWCQSGLAGPDMNDPKGTWVSDESSWQARALVEAAGLRYVDDAYIGDVAREFGNDERGG
jgi:predicted CoA-binding protein